MTMTDRRTEEVISQREFLRILRRDAEAGNDIIGNTIVLFDGKTFGDIHLRNIDIPLSLSFARATFLGDFSLIDCRFQGNVIDLEEATIKGNVEICGLKKQDDMGFNILLRHAFVHGNIRIANTRVNWLSLGGVLLGNRILRKLDTPGLEITGGISWN